MIGGELEQGEMSRVELVGEDEIKKSYFEPTTSYHKPYLFTSSNKVYLFERCSEHEAHEQLLKYLPSEYPKIYSYKEKKWSGEKVDGYLAKLMNKTGIKNEDLNVCEVIMEFLPFEQLDHIVYDAVKNERDAIDMMKIYFRKLLNMIKLAHIQPNDFHSGNMLAKLNEAHKLEDLFIIDYGWYQRFQLVDELNERSINTGYKLDVKSGEVFKIDLKTGEKQSIQPTSEFTLSDYDAEMLLMDILSFEFKRITVYRCFHLLLQLMFGGKVIDIYTKALNELNCSERFCRLVNDALSNSRMEASMRNSLMGWLDMSRYDCCQTHRLLTLMRTNKGEMEAMVNKFKCDEEAIKKMTKDELCIYSHKEGITKTERRYIHILRNGISLIHEYLNLLGWVIRNEKKFNGSLFRTEFTDRFNEKEIKIGDEMKWDNLAAVTEIKEFSLSFGENHHGTTDSRTNNKNYLFEFINVPAAYIAHLTEDMTTYHMACNRENPDDANYFKFDTINRIIVGNEYLLNPANRYRVVEVTKGLKGKADYMKGIADDYSDEMFSFEYELVRLELV